METKTALEDQNSPAISDRLNATDGCVAIEQFRMANPRSYLVLLSFRAIPSFPWLNE